MIFSQEKIIRLEKVNSTNDYLLEQIRNGSLIDEGIVVISSEQTSGKGLDNNSWESEKGKNLTFSMLLTPHFLKAEQQFMLNKSMSLGVYDFIRNIINNRKVTVKWPNDIYVDDLKISGMLISNIIEGKDMLYSVVGIGVNVNQTEFSKYPRNPVSLQQILKIEFDLELMLQDLLIRIAKRYQQLRDYFFISINRDYFESLYRKNEFHFYIYQNEIVSAKITGISDFGLLQLLTSDSHQLECDFKEIEFIIKPGIRQPL